MHSPTVLAALLLTSAATAATPSDDLSDQLLGLTPEFHRALARAGGLLEIAPVHLPHNPPGDCNHYGWPVATMTGRSIVLMHRRIPGHRAQGAGGPDPGMSYGVVVRSEDGGKTWSAPYDLRDCMRPGDRNRGGVVPLSHRAKFDKQNTSPLGYKVHLHAIGTARDGSIVAINNHGVFRSSDEGRNWRHFSRALREDTFPHEIINIGPRILDHPRHGLLVFGNWFGEVDSYHKLDKQLVILSSRNSGETWDVTEHTVGFPQYEPAALWHDDRVLFVTRDQTDVRAHQQMTWEPGTAPRTRTTNLVDPRLVDTADLSWNPVTRRLELVRSERHRMEVWLWSLDPAEWSRGHWRRECRLLACSGKFYQDADGFHPAGAVIDKERSVQHIFVYAGHPNGPAGVFRITRTLRTPALTAALSAESPHILMLGDSITRGVRTGVTSEQTFATLTARALGVNVRNAGVGGQRTDQLLKTLPELIKTSPQFATVMYGTNDSYIDVGRTRSRLPVDTYRQNLQQIVERLRRAGITPVPMTPPRWADNAKSNGVGESPNRALTAYVDACRAVARDNKLPLVDHFADWSEAARNGRDLNDWTTDGCHPNPAGHERMAEHLLRVLRPLVAGGN